jgi:hypothetical protein
MKGTIVVDEIVLPVIDLSLVAGVIRIVAQAHGPMTLPMGEMWIRVHGEDGILLSASRGDLGVSPEEQHVPHDATTTISMDLQINRISSHAERRA